MSDIFVVDIETTGLRGEGLDHIVEVGIVKLGADLNPAPVYSAIVKPYYHLDSEWEQSWVFQNTSLKPSDVLCGKSYWTVDAEVRDILEGKPATSFNYEFDFTKFLNKYPWMVRNVPMPCIMKTAGREYGDELPCSQYSGCPSAQTTYTFLCPSNPAKLPNGIEEHRALSDAMMEGYILAEMIRRGDYEVDI